jgi:hypothetical protein
LAAKKHCIFKAPSTSPHFFAAKRRKIRKIQSLYLGPFLSTDYTDYSDLLLWSFRSTFEVEQPARRSFSEGWFDVRCSVFTPPPTSPHFFAAKRRKIRKISLHLEPFLFQKEV